MVNLLSLPKLELQVFDGDPMEYHTFIREFDANVDKVYSDPDSEIAQLLQYTSGDAHAAIAGIEIIG